MLYSDFGNLIPSGKHIYIYIVIAIENGPVEIVDFPASTGWYFPSFLVNVYRSGIASSWPCHSMEERPAMVPWSTGLTGKCWGSNKNETRWLISLWFLHFFHHVISVMVSGISTISTNLWLVVWLPSILFSHILGISSSQLTFIFFRGVAQPPTRSSCGFMMSYGLVGPNMSWFLNHISKGKMTRSLPGTPMFASFPLGDSLGRILTASVEERIIFVWHCVVQVKTHRVFWKRRMIRIKSGSTGNQMFQISFGNILDR